MEAAFNRRRRRDPTFAREWRAALAAGYDRLEEALIAGAMPENHEHDAWRHNDTPALPTMTANQMLQLMYLHQKEARLGGSPLASRRKRGEPREVYNLRMTLLAEARMEQEREKYRVAEAMRRAAEGPDSPHEEEVVLPDLSQVSRGKASRTAPYWSDRALFGGFRAEHLTAAQRAKAVKARARSRE